MTASSQIEGPDGYWSDQLPPSRGQWKDIALVACELLGIPKPESRLDATVAMVRLRAAVTDKIPQGGGPGAVVNLDAKLDVRAARHLVSMPVEDAREIVEQSATDLHERRLRRQRRGRSGQVARCKGCNVFRSSTAGLCSRCGFDQDTGWAA